MKPREYKDMMSWLTRNKSTNMKDHIVDTLNKFEDPGYAENIMKAQVRKTNANNANPGTYKRLVEEDEKAYKKSQQKKQTNASPDILRNLLIEEMKTRDLDSDEIRYLMDTKDRSEVSKATPKQTAFIENKVVAKPFKKIPREIKFDPTPIVPMPTVIRDPLAEEQTRKFHALQREVEAEKAKNRTEGIAGLLGGNKAYV